MAKEIEKKIKTSVEVAESPWRNMKNYGSDSSKAAKIRDVRDLHFFTESRPEHQICQLNSKKDFLSERVTRHKSL